MKQVFLSAAVFWTVTLVLAATFYDPARMVPAHQIQVVPAASHEPAEPEEGEES